MILAVTGEYPADWEEIARCVKEEAHWRCVRCRHPDPPDYSPRGKHPCDELCTHDGQERTRNPDEEWVTHSTKQRVLTVHHLDGQKDNCVWWNTLALCQCCHLSIQARVIPQRPYLWDHSAWFLPYVCGFYAHYYGEVEISRRAAEMDPERWLRLGQPWLYEGRET